MKLLGIRMVVPISNLGKRQKRFATVALIFCAVYLSLFSIAQMISFWHTGTEQTELITMTFTVIGIECGGLLLKRIVEKIFPKKKNEEEDL